MNFRSFQNPRLKEAERILEVAERSYRRDTHLEATYQYSEKDEKKISYIGPDMPISLWFHGKRYYLYHVERYVKPKPITREDTPRHRLTSWR